MMNNVDGNQPNTRLTNSLKDESVKKEDSPEPSYHKDIFWGVQGVTTQVLSTNEWKPLTASPLIFTDILHCCSNCHTMPYECWLHDNAIHAYPY